MELEALSRRFARFAQAECGSSLLYHQIASGIAADERVLWIATAVAAGQPTPNLLLGAVHYLLMRGDEHELRMYYPSLGGDRPADAVYEVFADFVLANADAVRDLLVTRRVQTNEVARGAVLLPALTALARDASAGPIALVEVGASAGLLLLFDHYFYSYGNLTAGDAASGVRIHCKLCGDLPPPVTDLMPPVVRRVGIDLSPVDLRDDDQALWLRALVWPDQRERAERLHRSIAIARRKPPELMCGDGGTLAGEVVRQLPQDVSPVVLHAHTLNQFSPQAQDAFEQRLRELSQERRIYRIGMEGAARDSECRLRTYEKGRVQDVILADYHAHGQWLRWRRQV